MKSKSLTHGLLLAQLFLSGSLFSQASLYDDFEGHRFVSYGERSGVLDSMAKNPAPNEVNSSARCALYVRNGSKKFDNIKMSLNKSISDVDKYATYLGIPPKFKLKVYTSAPPGTLVEILLGSKKGNNDYPAGTHSQYQAYTKTSNKWEELEFLFSQIPQGSETSAAQIDQVVLLFNPNSSNSDTYYFDDLTGPTLGTPTASNMAVEEQQEAPADDPKTQSVNTPKPVATPTIGIDNVSTPDKKQSTTTKKKKKENK